ncbi:MAG: tetratricopeptide repeat protein [Planctomycetota bacterium]|jgi:tetratricopeptide (TPR) repeat protein
MRVLLIPLALLLVACSPAAEPVAKNGAAVPPADDRAQVADAVRAAKRADASGDPAVAEEAWNRVLALRPDHAAGLYAAASCAWSRGNAAVALSHLEHLRTVDPHAGRAFLLSARIRSDPAAGPLRDLDRARTLAEAGLRLNPEDSGPYAVLAEVLWLRGDVGAGERLSDAARMNPRDLRSRVWLGILHLRNGREKDARGLLAVVRDAGGTLEVGTGDTGIAGEGDSAATARPDPGPALLARAALALLGEAAAGEDVPAPVRSALQAALDARGTGEATLPAKGERPAAAVVTVEGRGMAFACLRVDGVSITVKTPEGE